MTSAQRGSLDALFRPRGVAVIGAAPGDQKIGGRTLEILRSFGYVGGIYPVNPNYSAIDGLPCYASIADVPGPVDLAVLCIGSGRMADAVRECALVGVQVAVVYAGDYSGDEEAVRRREELRRVHEETGIRILGPNTVGSRGVVQDGVFATFSHDVEEGITPGSVAIVAQSGGLGVYFGSAYLRKRGTGTRYLVDTGNELDITAAEVIENVIADPEVTCVGLILEGSHDGRRLSAAVESATRAGKPVVFLKTGRSAASAASMASHTGAIAGNARLFEIALRDAGAHVVEDELEFVDTLYLADRGVRLSGRRIGIVTPSGGFAIMSVDAADRYGMTVPPATEPATEEEARVLASGDLVNPFDYTSKGAVTPETLEYSFQWMARQDVDVIVFWQAYALFLPWRQDPLRRALDKVMPGLSKPIIGCGLAPQEFVDELASRGIAWFEEPTRLIRALSIVAPADVDTRVEPPQAEQSQHGVAEEIVVGDQARRILAFMPHVATTPVSSSLEAELVAASGRIVLKVESGAYPHKTEFGLVTGPLELSHVTEAFERIRAARDRLGLDEPIVAQPVERGVELVMGAFRDPAFGPCVLVGLGGVHVEIFRDVQLAVAPIDADKAEKMIRSLRAAALLLGARGAQPADVSAAAAALAALSRFMVESGDEWESVDLNPVFVRAEGEGIVAVDALLVPREEVQVHV